MTKFKNWKLVTIEPRTGKEVVVNAENDVGHYTDDVGNSLFMILEKENNRGWTFAAYRKCSRTVEFFYSRGDYKKIMI